MSWYNGIEYLDSLVKDYLAYRKLNKALKAFEADIKADKDKAFRVEKVVQFILQMVHTYDIDGLVSYWRYLNERFFCRFASFHTDAVAKFEADLYRLYMVHCVQNSKPKELQAVLQKITDLGDIPALKDWYVLMFITAPEKKLTFAPYFTRKWSETYIVSLHNFLAAIFSIMPEPDLVRAIREDGKKILELEKENAKLKEQLANRDTDKQPPESTSSVPIPNYVKALGVPGALRSPGSQTPERTKKSTSKPVLIKGSPGSSETFTIGSPNKSSSASLAAKDQLKKEKETSKFTLFKKSPSFGGSTAGKAGTPPAQSSGDVNANRSTALNTVQPEKAAELSNMPNLEERSSSPAEILYAKTISLEKAGDSLQQVTGATAHPPVLPKDIPGTSKSILSSSLLDRQPLISTSTLFPQHDTRSPPTYQRDPFIILSKDIFQEHHSAVVQCKFDNTGSTIASVETSGVVKVWQNEPIMKSLATVIMHKPIQCLEWCNKPTDTLLLGTSNGMIRFFDVAKNVSITDVTIDSEYCCFSCVRSHPSGTSLVTSSVKPSETKQKSDWPVGVITVWDVSTTRVKQFRNLVGNSSFAVTCIDYNHNGNLLVTGDISGCITLFDMKTCTVIHSCQAHDGAISFVEFSTDETLVYSFGVDNELMARNINYWQRDPIKFGLAGASGPSLSDDSSNQRHLVLSPDGKHALLSCGSRGLVYELNPSLPSVTHVLSLPEQRSAVSALDWIAIKACGHCLTGSSDGKIQVTTLLMQT